MLVYQPVVHDGQWTIFSGTSLFIFGTGIKSTWHGYKPLWNMYLGMIVIRSVRYLTRYSNLNLVKTVCKICVRRIDVCKFTINFPIGYVTWCPIWVPFWRPWTICLMSYLCDPSNRFCFVGNLFERDETSRSGSWFDILRITVWLVFILMLN